MKTNLMVLALSGLLLVSPVLQAAPQQPPAAAPAAMVDLNTAGISELEALPGVGRQMAERIIEYRQKSGGFKKVEELMNVRGIGEKSFLKLKPLVVVKARAEKASGAR